MPERHTIATLAEVPPGTARAFAVSGRRIAVYNVDGTLYATDDTCSHAEASLAEGSLEGTTITCPWHGAEFDVTSGKVLCLPAARDLKTYPISVRGDSIEVELA